MANRDNKRSIRQKIQDFMSTPKGQTIMNYAYNWGAAIVIMGTLFKLTHLPGANFMLFAGMGTEVLIFFLSAFDLSGVKRGGTDAGTPLIVGAMPVGTESMGGGTVPTGGSNPSIVVMQGAGAPVQPVQPAQFIQPTPPAQPVHFTPPVQPIQPVVNPVTNAPVTPEMEEATKAYLEQLKAMTEMLSRCTEQTHTISQDTEQMNLLSKNLAGINAIYEMQLRSASTQIGTIDQVHEQTRRMARQIEELNEVYARMLQAMTSK